MSYCTLDDIKRQLFESELIRLTDEEDAGVIDTDKVDTAISTAEVEINAYLGKQYSLPLASPPEIVTKLAADLAIRNLYLLSNGGVPESREKQAANAIKMLVMIAEGKLTLGVDDPQAGMGSSSNSVQLTSAARVFSREKMRGW